MRNAENAMAPMGAAGPLKADKQENAMPRELWDLFEKKPEQKSSRRIIAKNVEIFPEEEAMPLYRYFSDYPLRYPSAEVLKYIEAYSPMDPSLAIMPQNFTDLLTADGYDQHEIGYCVFPDGSGYVAAYGIRPAHITDEMEQWYRNWSNQSCRSAVRGHGNLRYKIANPADHFENRYINHMDETLGVYFRESIDLGGGGKRYEVIRHSFSLEEYGVGPEQMDALKKSGCIFEGKGSYETFTEPGSNLSLSIARPCPLGGMEIRNRKWIGWRPVNGMLVRDPFTKCTQAYLKDMLIHMLVEREHLYTFLYELYAEYHEQPIDAD